MLNQSVAFYQADYRQLKVTNSQLVSLGVGGGCRLISAINAYHSMYTCGFIHSHCLALIVAVHSVIIRINKHVNSDFTAHDSSQRRTAAPYPIGGSGAGSCTALRHHCTNGLAMLNDPHHSPKIVPIDKYGCPLSCASAPASERL